MTSPAPTQPRPTSGAGPLRGFDIGTIVGVFHRRWKLFLCVFVPVLLLSILATIVIKPMFSADAKLKIDANQQSPIDPVALLTGTPPDQAVIDTEVALMKSRKSGEAIVDRYNLSADPEFAPAGASSPIMARELTIDAVLSRLNIARESTTYVINVGFRSRDPVKAATLANAFARQYIINSAQSRIETARQQSTSLDARLTSLGAAARGADEQLAQYRARTGLMESGSGGTITEQQIAPLSSGLAVAESEAAAARAAASAARGQVARGGLDAVSGVLTSNVIADMRSKRAEIMRELDQVNARYGKRHPDYIRVNDQLEGIDRQIADESRRIVSGLESDAQAANARAGSLRAELGRLRAEQAQNTRAAATADNLKRQADAQSAVYTQTQIAAQRSNQDKNNAQAHERIVEAATVPIYPIYPNKKLFVLLGTLAGAFLGIAVLFVVEMLSATVRTVEDVEGHIRLPFLGSVPLLTPRQRLDRNGREMTPWEYLVERPTSSYAEALRGLRASLLASDPPKRKVTITSALPHEGKTATAIGLARLMALSDDRVVLVDCDLRRNAASQLVPDASAGLVELLAGDATLEDCLYQDVVPGLSILPLRQASFTPKDLFHRPAMSELLDRLGRDFDFVILDTPPVLAVTDTRTVAQLGDAIVMMIRWNKTKRAAVQAAVARLEQDKLDITGCMLSMADFRVGRLSQSDPAYYSSAYASYYRD